MHFRKIAAALCAVLSVTLASAAAASPKVAVSDHKFMVNGCCAGERDAQHGAQTVSYTHLAVYKRQALIPRPALSGRALLCAADNARKIQGLTASQNLFDARNRAPVTSV